MRFRTSRPSVLAIGLVLSIGALSSARAPTAHAGAAHAVDIVDFTFAPATLTIAVGDTVTWTNRDPVVHTATSTAGAFDSGDLDQDDSYSFTFTTPGTYDYLCTPHPSMTGRIVVEVAAPTPAPTALPTSAPTPTAGPLPNVAMPPPRSPLVAIVGVGFLAAALAVAAVRLRRR